MAFTRHGWHIPFSDREKPIPRKPCLGGNGCKACSLDVRKYWLGIKAAEEPREVASDIPETRKIRGPGLNLNYSITSDDCVPTSDEIRKTAEEIVREHIDRGMRKRRSKKVEEYDVHILWMTENLLSWRAVMVTSFQDNKYYEVRHDDILNETTLHAFHRFFVSTIVKLDQVS